MILFSHRSQPGPLRSGHGDQGTFDGQDTPRASFFDGSFLGAFTEERTIQGVAAVVCGIENVRDIGIALNDKAKRPPPA
ncbi:hypothetical protein FGK63_10240 [Ruegeria sediminis]|uniref:Uncharacterized protein n=1 Tax=Ruegeria sediminis TaxID=2583820 RepID=A0ABY2WY88_9RHOB|nr:hypothetical protein [Ruegeria sediminis]TMV07829.1 hypothetical protein FGK63_10240 [Ruegeria sediminis]